ncbi:MAG: uroporphyrinogen decarboxylase family protein [Clostridiaceae bacterium]|nr:uroporphyrinogen decarboxylase family protein [Clostridiaceae bacterium]
MEQLTGHERIGNILQRKPVDRIGVYEHFWDDTHREWARKGWVGEEQDLVDYFDFDLDLSWPFNMVADLDFVPQVVEETAETILRRDGNGALLRTHKLHSSTPEHVDFLVKEREAWEEYIKPRLKPDRRRINFEAYRLKKRQCRDKQRFFMWSGVNVFEQMHPVCGHENLLYGMAMDPDWVMDMVRTYSELTVALQEILFAEEGKPDGIFYYEDMGFSGRPFMSPAMYDEIIKPGHERTIRYSHSLGLPVVMHSCGMVEKLLPGMIDAGIDCLQVIEVKAGMDLLKLYQLYGDRLSFFGGMDIRELYTNDLARVDRELEAKIPTVMKNYGYILHSDHSIPHTVNLATYQHFKDYGLELGTY